MTTVSVYGLGYVGLPTAALFANNGYTVFGIDTQPDRINTLRTNGADFQEADLNKYVNRALEKESFTLRQRPTTSEYHLICVPTPYHEQEGSADLSYVRAAAESIAPQLRSGDTVIVESTVPPGTTSGVVDNILRQQGHVHDNRFNLAFSPETILPGSILTELRQNDRIVGAVDEMSTIKAQNLFESAIEGNVHCVGDATAAEFAKLAQNTYRDANIAIANELAKVARDYDLVPREVFELANEHPRVSILHPGPGVGGHCLPIDPLYLGQNSDNVDLIERAREVNDNMIQYVREMLVGQIETLSDKRIAIFGLAYKGDVADTRNSPSKRLVEALTEMEPKLVTDGGDIPAEVRVHDPHVTDAEVELYERLSALNGADALVFMTDHSEFDSLSPATVAQRMRGDLILDAKGITEPEWSEMGLTVERL